MSELNGTQCECRHFQLDLWGSLVWKTSRHTMMLEGGSSHIEAHGFSLITTVSPEVCCRMTSFYCLCHASTMLCEKVIAEIFCFNHAWQLFQQVCV